MLNQVVAKVTANIKDRSIEDRINYLSLLVEQEKHGNFRKLLSDSNLAHAAAGSDIQDRQAIIAGHKLNVAILSSYSEIVAAHSPYRDYPQQLKEVIRQCDATAQLAGCVADIDHKVTSSQYGSQISFFARDVIAKSTTLSLSHNCFDAVLLLGSSESSVLGMLMGCAHFAHLPVAFVPTGTMPTWLNYADFFNTKKKIKAGKLDKSALQQVESRMHHSPGLDPFFDADHSMLLMLEAMGLILPGASFVESGCYLRNALNEQVARNVLQMPDGSCAPSLCEIVTAENLVNGLICGLAVAGSMNMTVHLIALAKAFGFTLKWEDIAMLSEVVPILANLDPLSKHDINDFQRAGGVPVLLKSLSKRHLLHENVRSIAGDFAQQLKIPVLNEQQKLDFIPSGDSNNASVLISDEKQHFAPNAGLKLMQGDLGLGFVDKRSLTFKKITAPVKIFESQEALMQAFKQKQLKEDTVIVLRNMGPKGAGFPELVNLQPMIARLNKEGLKIALVTDGRLAGAAGKILAMVHVSPEAAQDGPLAFVQDGDIIKIDVENGVVHCESNLVLRSLERKQQLLNAQIEKLSAQKILVDNAIESFVPRKDKVKSQCLDKIVANKQDILLNENIGDKNIGHENIGSETKHIAESKSSFGRGMFEKMRQQVGFTHLGASTLF